MIPKPTVFILGAGASVPYGFPTGSQLTKNICKNVWNGNYLTDIAKEISPHWESDARLLADQLAKATISIDTWLSHRTDQEKNIGKYLIARAIIEHESLDNLREAFTDDKDWYADLWAMLLPLESRGGVKYLYENAPVAFITFNYDRSLEQSLITKVQSTFRDSIEDCAKVIAERFPIIHVHGQLGRLPWQNNLEVSGIKIRDYDSACDLKTAFASAAHIKIMGEDNGVEGPYRAARTLLEEAERIHFLGFGYHDENLKRLKPRKLQPKATIGGTHLNLGEGRKETFQTNSNAFGYAINMKHDFKNVLDYFRNAVWK